MNTETELAEAIFDKRADAMLDQILFYAHWHSWIRRPNGHHSALFMLKRPFYGMPIGHLLTLRELHERLAR